MEMTARDRKALFVLLGVAVLGLLLFVFVLHKGGTNAASPSSVSAGSPASQPTTTPHHPHSGKPGHKGHTQHPKPQPTPSPSPEVRDPFQPLVAESPNVSSPAPSPAVSPAPSPSP